MSTREEVPARAPQGNEQPPEKGSMRPLLYLLIPALLILVWAMFFKTN